MLVPAGISAAAGTLLVPHRVIADIVFVVIMIIAVYVRRFGLRGAARLLRRIDQAVVGFAAGIGRGDEAGRISTA